MLTFLRTFLKGVSDEACRAGARRDVVEDPALCLGSTGARTGVHTLVPIAGFLSWTV